ncbi:Ig-like domain-containing protein [Haloarcula salinisoli]|uniref:Tandem-95 repeat protein n=1 Tax=Haloarcula salinisoli TaxID=2487746 RepID=A0A8J7YHR1_9EURY|nr:Ig-like domain-containing protein [Halomicroarcula salinisoli]MBX0305767.1 tandem-95 repeat protein [Halomicroarcula salinisoli]
MGGTRIRPDADGYGGVVAVKLRAVVLSVLMVFSIATVGVSPAAAQAAGNASISPSAVDFGQQSVGNTASQDVTVTNDGGSEIEVTGVEVAGADGDDYTVTSGASGATLAAGDSLTATVEYSPGDTADDSATLTVSYGDGTTSDVSLSGTGTPATLSGTVTDFGAGVENATVVVNGTDTATTTDADGTYAVTVTESSVDLTVYHEFVGGTNATVTPTVSVSGDTTRDIAFDRPTPADLPGDGSADDPYEISTVRELQAMNDSLDANYTLTADIDASRTAQWRAVLTRSRNDILYRGFVPVGKYFRESEPVRFNGTFDGDGHTISNLSTDYGLFAAIGEPGVVRNVHVTDANVTPPADQTLPGDLRTNAGIIARENHGTIAASNVEGRVVPNEGTFEVGGYELVFRDVGGVAGLNSRSGVIQNVSANATVTLRSTPERLTIIGAGGLVDDNRGVIRNVTVDADVTSPFLAGGLASRNDGVIREATVDGEVTNLGYSFGEFDGLVGGVVGEHRGDGVITDVASGADINRNSTDTVGGGVVANLEGTSRINDTYVTGTVSGAAGDDGQTPVGPVVGGVTVFYSGSDGWNGVVRDTYWNEETAGQAAANVDGTTNLTTGEMTGPNATVTMAGLEFYDDWLANETGYPRLVAQVPDEDGTASAPFEVSNPYDLSAVGRNRSAAYRLTDDIDASSRPLNTGDGFDPLGNDTVAFTGSFDGADHTVSNLTLDRPGNDSVGFFGVLDGGAVHNLTLADATVTGADGTGGLVGRAIGGDVTNVTLDSVVVTGGNRTGGVVGNMTGGTVGNISVTDTTVTGANRTGGTVGSYDTTIRYFGQPLTNISVDNATVTGTNRTGGVVGFLNGEQLQNTSASGVIVTGSRSIGGAVGSNRQYVTRVNVNGTVDGDSAVGGVAGANDGVVIDVTTNASVDGDTAVGGVVGENIQQLAVASVTATVTGNESVGGAVGRNTDYVANVTADGSVEGDSAVAGLVGENTGTVKQAYTVASVIGDSDAGGAVGTNSGTVTGVYWDTVVTGQDDSAGGRGLTTAEMTDVAAVSNMTAFDFETGWALTESYPVLAERYDGELPIPFRTTITDTNAPVLTGETLTVDVRVENLGEFTATDRLELLGIDAAQVDNTDVTLLGGGETDITLTWTPETAQSGDVTLVSPGTNETAPVTVGQSGANFNAIITDANDTVTAGETVQVDYEVTNDGASGAEQTIGFTVDGEQVGSETVTLLDGESTTGTFTYTASASDAPTVTVGVTTDDDIATRDVSVNRVPTATADSYTTVENGTLAVGASEGVLANDTDPDGDALTVTTTPVAGPSNGSLALESDGSFQYTPDEGFVGTDSFTYEVSDGTDTDTATVTLSVAEEPAFAVDITDVNVTVTAGDTIAVRANVSNGGAVAATQPVTLGTNGTEVASRSVSVPAGDETTTTFTYATTADDPPAVTVTVASPTASDEATVAVEQPSSGSGPAGMFGSGTAEDPYVVTNATQLQAMNVDLDASYTLGNDIDASATETWNDGAGFDPVGDDTTPFTGSFDGEDRAIAGLTVTRATQNDTGLFGVVGDGATVGNVTLTDADVTGQNQVGIAVGNNSGGRVRSVGVTGTVTGENDVGGLVGRNAGTVARSSASATVGSSGGSVGGLVGGNVGGTVTESYATGDVGSPDASSVGGLVGLSSAGTVNESYATGNATGDAYVGGLVGDVRTVETSGSVVERSYAAGVVTGNTNVGGIVGGMAGTFSGATADLRESYFDERATDQSAAVGFSSFETVVEDNEGFETGDGQGRADEMTGPDAPGNLTAFEFGTTWATREEGYPVLSWQPAANAAPAAADDSYTVAGDETLAVESGGLLTNDDDPDGDALTVTTTPVAGPSNGRVALDADGSFEYTPDDGFTGEDSFTYQVSDGSGGTDTATVTITVTEAARPANLTVTITGTNAPVTEGEKLSVTASVTNVGELADSQPVTLEAFNGDEVDTRSLTLAAGNETNVTLAWETSEGDADSGTITVRTANDTATRSVSVEEADDDDGTSGSGGGGGGGGAEPNDPPNATDDAYTAVENTTLTVAADGGVLDDDTDPDGDALSVTVESGPTNGTLALAENGSFEYTPEPGFAGTDSFSYEVRDSEGGDDTATVTIMMLSETVEWSTSPAFDDETIRLAVGEERRLNVSEARLSDEEIASYEWSIDGRERSGETTTLAFEEAGEYTVELSVTNAAGQTATVTTTVVVENETDAGPTGGDTPSQTPTTDPTTTTSGDGAGFGIVLALVALLGAALLAARKRS